nr:hypothetical protein GCM10010200_110490 [Actinomadura rugatobispora]
MRYLRSVVERRASDVVVKWHAPPSNAELSPGRGRWNGPGDRQVSERFEFNGRPPMVTTFYVYRKGLLRQSRSLSGNAVFPIGSRGRVSAARLVAGPARAWAESRPV